MNRRERSDSAQPAAPRRAVHRRALSAPLPRHRRGAPSGQVSLRGLLRGRADQDQAQPRHHREGPQVLQPDRHPLPRARPPASLQPRTGVQGLLPAAAALGQARGDLPARAGAGGQRAEQDGEGQQRPGPPPLRRGAAPPQRHPGLSSPGSGGRTAGPPLGAAACSLVTERGPPADATEPEGHPQGWDTPTRRPGDAEAHPPSTRAELPGGASEAGSRAALPVLITRAISEESTSQPRRCATPFNCVESAVSGPPDPSGEGISFFLVNATRFDIRSDSGAAGAATGGYVQEQDSASLSTEPDSSTDPDHTACGELIHWTNLPCLGPMQLKEASSAIRWVREADD